MRKHQKHQRELQSVNEELINLNSEYQARIQELTELNNDMDNFISSTHIGTVILGQHLQIRKYTPAIKEVIHVMPGTGCGSAHSAYIP